jgi:6,7-dimethyl-8-ribityllumazine synthase
VLSETHRFQPRQPKLPNLIPTSPVDASDRYAIVVAEWNRSITSQLLEGAVTTLCEANIQEDHMDVAWVPGSWEIPLVAQQFAKQGNHVAVICLGAVIRGETTHDQHINRGVSLALSQIGLEAQLPVLFGILTCETMEQAIHRAGGQVGNKGADCATAAMQMVGLLKNIPSPGESYGRP